MEKSKTNWHNQKVKIRQGDKETRRQGNVKKLILLFFCFLIILSSYHLIIVSSLQAKWPGAKFLSINPSIRASAMGDAFVAVADDASAVNLNPAGLAFLKQKEISIMYNTSFGLIDHGYLASAIPISKKLTSGGSLIYLNTKNEPIRDLYGNLTGKNLSYSGLAFTLPFAYKLASVFSAGTSFKLINDKLLDDSAISYAFDFGIMTKIYLGSGHWISAGIGAENLGKELRKDEPLPTIIRVIGIAHQWKGLKYTAEFDLNPYSSEDFFGKFGGEFWLTNRIAFRLGCQTQSSVPFRFGSGLGFKWKDYQLDYAWILYGILGNSHRMAITWRFGKERVVLEEKKRLPRKKFKFVPVEKRLNIAVAELSGKNVSAMDAAIVSDFLRVKLVNTQVFRVVEKDNMDKILDEQKFQASGCTTSECAVQMGKILNVQKIIVGTLSKLVGKYYISISFVDVETGEIETAETIKCESGDELIFGARELAERLAIEFSK